MATFRAGSFEQGQVTFDVTYNANNGRVQSIDCTNRLSLPCYGQITEPGSKTSYGREFPANATTSQNIPAGAITIRVVNDPETGEPGLQVRNSVTGAWEILPTYFRYPA